MTLYRSPNLKCNWCLLFFPSLKSSSLQKLLPALALSHSFRYLRIQFLSISNFSFSFLTRIKLCPAFAFQSWPLVWRAKAVLVCQVRTICLSSHLSVLNVVVNNKFSFFKSKLNCWLPNCIICWVSFALKNKRNLELNSMHKWII